MRGGLAAVGLLLLATVAGAVDAELRKLAKDADSFKRSDAARALGRDGSPEAAGILLELLADGNPYVRDHTVDAIGAISDPAALDVLSKAVKNRDPLFRTNLAEALGGTRAPAALDALTKLATDRETAPRAAAHDALWGFRDTAADEAAAVAATGVGDADAAVRAAAIEALGRLHADRASDLIRAALADPDVGVRAVARMELRWIAADAATSELVTAAADSAWQIRAQIVDDAFGLRRRESVDALIAVVADPRMRVAAASHRALIGLSGKDFGRDPELWRSWWETAREGWSAPDDPKLGEPPAGGTSASYHGLPIESDHVVFVLDASGSMRETEGEGTRWDLAVGELSKALDSLPDDARVNVVVFQEKARAAFDAPRPLSKKVRKDLVGFVRHVSPGESGDLLAGMLLALAQDDADTAFLLSDGAPSYGDMVDKQRVRRAIRAVNRRTKLVVNAVGLGAKKRTERSFLEGVTGDSGGRVVFR